MKSLYNEYNTDALIFTLLQMNRLSTHWIAPSVKRICKKRILYKKDFSNQKVLFGCLLYMMQKLISDISHWKNHYGPKNRIYN